MKLPPPVLSALFAAAALVPAGAGAWSLFSSERSRLWKEIEEARQRAAEERSEGRVMGEIEALSDAGRSLADMASRFPDYRPEEVEALRFENADRMRELMTGVRSGKIAVPEPDAAWRGEDAAAVPDSALNGMAGPAEGPAFHLGIPDLVRVESPEAPAPEDSSVPDSAGDLAEAAPAQLASLENMTDDERRIRSTIPNPFFKKDAVPGPAPAPPAQDAAASAELPAPPAPPAQDAAASAGLPAPPAPPIPAAPSVRVSIRESGIPLPPTFADDDPATQLRAIAEMIRTARAPDAVILLEDIVRDPAFGHAVEARALLARALLECGNYPRAVEELDALPASAASDPAVRTLRAAAFLATGRPQEAMLQLDLLMEEHPDWSDAYIDCAYVLFLIDPSGNRDDAIDCYQEGLSRGARRDPRLERELGVRVER